MTYQQKHFLILVLKYLQFSESWFKSNFDVPIRPISDIVGSEVIDVKAANGSEIPVKGP